MNRNTTVVFDLETGGVEAKHPDIQLAAVAVRGWEEIDTFERKLQFSVDSCDPEALEINSYDPAVWEREALPEARVVAQFAQWMRRHAVIHKVSKRGNPYSVARLAGHNVARFDAPRLLAMFKRHGAFLAADAFRPLDTLQLALWHFAGREDEPENYKLGTLATALGIATDGAHDALADVRMTVQLAKAICERSNG